PIPDSLSNQVPTDHIAPLSLHDALPIYMALRTLWIRIDLPLKRSSAAALSDRIATRSSTALRAMDWGTCLAALASPVRLFDTRGDRKSTRLKSSHGSISYAVFCLKTKHR